MINTDSIKKEIKSAFKDATFPTHLGIRAAEVIDDWVSDPEVLKEITKKEDFKGNWWDIPEEHISGNGLGFNYLDSEGIEYYLPAFMTLAIEKPIYKNLNTLLYALDPGYNDDEVDLYKHYCDRFSRVKGKRKEVTFKFLHYLREQLEIISIYDLEHINKVIAHDYWQTK